MDPRNPTKFPVERLRAPEHVVHGGYARHVPLPDVTVERCRLFEHVAHVNHARHVPPRDIIIE